MTTLATDHRQVTLRTIGRLLSDLGHEALTEDDCLVAIEPLSECLGVSRATLVLLPDRIRPTELACTAEFADASAASAETRDPKPTRAMAGPILALALSVGTTRLGSLYLERPIDAAAFADEEVLFARGIAGLIALRLSERGREQLRSGPHATIDAMESAMRVATTVGHDLNNILVVMLAAAQRLSTDERESRHAGAEIESLAHRAMDLVRLQLDATERARRTVAPGMPRSEASA